MASTEKIRVMIADDHPIVLQGAVRDHPRRKRHARGGEKRADGRQLVEMFREHRPERDVDRSSHARDEWSSKLSGPSARSFRTRASSS